MAAFAYRVLPPCAEFWSSIGPEEVAALARYLEHLQRLRQEGSVRFVGRAPNGDHSLMLVAAEDEAHASTIARSDPAVSEGLMRIERHAFLVVLDGGKAAHGAAPRT